MPKANFETVTLSTTDADEIRALSQELTKDLGVRISPATTIRLAVQFYKQRRKLAVGGEK